MTMKLKQVLNFMSLKADLQKSRPFQTDLVLRNIKHQSQDKNSSSPLHTYFIPAFGYIKSSACRLYLGQQNNSQSSIVTQNGVVENFFESCFKLWVLGHCAEKIKKRIGGWEKVTSFSSWCGKYVHNKDSTNIFGWKTTALYPAKSKGNIKFIRRLIRASGCIR